MMAFTTINGVRYHFGIEGTGSRLVLLHGFSGSAENWTPLVANLCKHHRVLSIDLLGHGQTDAPEEPQRYRMEHAAADLIALIDEVISEPCHLLGYSMGGRLALYTAIHYSQWFTTLILESASPGLATEAERIVRRQRDNELADRIERDGIVAFVDYWEQIPLFTSQRHLSEEYRARLRAQRLQNHPMGLANSLRGMGTGVQPSLWERLPELKMPTLLLAGELDTKFVGIAQQMYDLMPVVQLQIIRDAGHTIHLETPEPYSEVVLRFLATAWRT